MSFYGPGKACAWGCGADEARAAVATDEWFICTGCLPDWLAQARRAVSWSDVEHERRLALATLVRKEAVAR